MDAGHCGNGHTLFRAAITVATGLVTACVCWMAYTVHCLSADVRGMQAELLVVRPVEVMRELRELQGAVERLDARQQMILRQLEAK